MTVGESAARQTTRRSYSKHNAHPASQADRQQTLRRMFQVLGFPLRAAETKLLAVPLGGEVRGA